MLFKDNMIAACEKALDAKVFYQDDFNEFVLQHMGGPDCQPLFVRKLVISPGMNFLEEARPLIMSFEKEIGELPRGSYGLIERVKADGSGKIFDTFMSDGTGGTAVGGKFDHYEEEPSGTHILNRMIGYEIYQCRHHIQKLREADEDNAAVSKYFLFKGNVYKDFRISGDNYSTATITDIYPTGQVKVKLVKRGSRKRWLIETRALHFVEYAGLNKTAKVSSDLKEESLFADCCF